MTLLAELSNLENISLLTKLEMSFPSLANLSFLSLFVSMIFYWIGTSFQDFKLTPVLTSLPRLVPAPSGKATEGVGKSIEEYEVSSKENSSINGGKNNENSVFSFSYNLAQYGILVSNLLLGLLLGLRWKESGHFPLSNLYESLMFLSWCFTVIHLFIENYTFPFFSKTSLTFTKSSGLSRNLLGAITTPSALLTNAFATFTLPKEMQESSALVPALQSNWLMMHVTVMIISYSALIIGSLLSIAFLIITFVPFTNPEGSGSNDNKGMLPSEVSKKITSVPISKVALMLDNLSYRILGIGFPFLTIGILSGAVWANEAWGSYWSWDPKETWALLTWLIFAIYLHTRLSKGWEGKKPAIIASFGFVIVWICYLGVNLIGEGLHSYGWITT